jgi:hypothetical protein
MNPTSDYEAVKAVVGHARPSQEDMLLLVTAQLENLEPLLRDAHFTLEEHRLLTTYKRTLERNIALAKRLQQRTDGPSDLDIFLDHPRAFGPEPVAADSHLDEL